MGAAHSDSSIRSGTPAGCVIVLLYRYVIRKDIGDFSSFERARRPNRLPVVLSRSEVARVLGELTGTDKLVAQLLYGAGLRLSEALNMRVKDLDLESRQVIVRSGRGDRDRMTVLPTTVVTALKMHLVSVKAMHNNDLAQGFGETALPNALARKYPDAADRGDGSTSSRLQYYLAHAPAVSIAGRRDLGSSVHLLTYKIDTGEYRDHGTLMGPDDRRIFFTESVAIGPDDRLYSVAWVETLDPERMKRVQIARDKAVPEETKDIIYEIQLVRMPPWQEFE